MYRARGTGYAHARAAATRVQLSPATGLPLHAVLLVRAVSSPAAEGRLAAFAKQPRPSPPAKALMLLLGAQLVAAALLVAAAGAVQATIQCSSQDYDCAQCLGTNDTRPVWASPCLWLSGPVDGGHRLPAWEHKSILSRLTTRPDFPLSINCEGQSRLRKRCQDEHEPRSAWG
jgi:hypothetical protein